MFIANAWLLKAAMVIFRTIWVLCQKRNNFGNNFPPDINIRYKKGKRKFQGVSQSQKKVREKSRNCHNHKPQIFPDTKRKRKPQNQTSTNRTKSTNFSSLFPKPSLPQVSQQSQTAALPRYQEEEETDKIKEAQIEQTYEKH